jgi:hypothetical protein
MGGFLLRKFQIYPIITFSRQNVKSRLIFRYLAKILTEL